MKCQIFRCDPRALAAVIAALVELPVAFAAAPITALVFSPDGSELLSNGPGHIVSRSPTNAGVQREVACDLRKISQLAFHPRDRRLAVAGGSPGAGGQVRLLDWPGGAVRQRFTNFTDVVTSTAFSPDGKFLAGASADHSIQVWHFASGESDGREKHHLVGHAGPVLAVGFSPQGNFLVSTAADRSLKVWSTADGQLLRTFTQHTEAVHALAFRPAIDANEKIPDFAASAGEDRTVRIWQPEIGRLVRIIRGHGGPVFTLAYAADGLTLFSAGQEGIIRRLDATSDRVVSEWSAHEDWIYSLAVSPNGRQLASGDWAGQVRVWDLRLLTLNPERPPK